MKFNVTTGRNGDMVVFDASGREVRGLIDATIVREKGQCFIKMIAPVTMGAPAAKAEAEDPFEEIPDEKPKTDGTGE